MKATLDTTIIHHFFQAENHFVKNNPFYDLYVKRWGSDETVLTWDFFKENELGQLRERVTWVEKTFDYFVEKFYSHSKLIPRPIIFKPFIGNYLSSGWAECDGDQAIVYFGIECYETKEQIEVFFYHEFAHGYHLAANSDFRVMEEQDFYSISRNLIFEGIATFTTKKVLNSDDLFALWGNNTKAFLKDWHEACMKTENEMCNRLRLDINKTDQDTFFHWFGMEDNTLGREGYYIGLQWIKKLYKRVNTLQQVMSLSLDQVYEKIRIDN